MLVLTRKKEETIIIGGSVTVKVLEVCGKRVKLGIDAPPEVPIQRPEMGELRRAVITRRPRFMVERVPVGADY